MINDDRFLDVPPLPQYGEMKAICDANLPSAMSAIVMVFAGFGFFLAFGLLLQLVMEMPVPNPQIRAVALATGGIALLFVTRFTVKKVAGGFNQQAMFVFDGGIHLNEDVTYTVSYGRSFDVCSGRRRVSIPWRMLNKFKVRETKHKGTPAVEASVMLPDGRRLKISTLDGKQSVTAIETMITKLR